MDPNEVMWFIGLALLLMLAFLMGTEFFLFVVQLPDYHEIIEHPMDFSTVRKKLFSRAYASLEQFEVGQFTFGIRIV